MYVEVDHRQAFTAILALALECFAELLQVDLVFVESIYTLSRSFVIVRKHVAFDPLESAATNPKDVISFRRRYIEGLICNVHSLS